MGGSTPRVDASAGSLIERMASFVRGEVAGVEDQSAKTVSAAASSTGENSKRTLGGVRGRPEVSTNGCSAVWDADAAAVGDAIELIDAFTRLLSLDDSDRAGEVIGINPAACPSVSSSRESSSNEDIAS